MGNMLNRNDQLTSGRSRAGLALLAGLALGLTTLGVSAGNLDSPAAPTDPASAMYRLEDVYNRLETGAAGAKRAGAFEEPASAPGATGHTLDQVMQKAPALDNTNGAAASQVAAGKTYWGLISGGWGLKIGTGTFATASAPVPRTGQTTSYAAGDDGAKQKGVANPNPRFTDNGNGTVTDNLTKLIWLKNANKWGGMDWWTAVNNCNNLAADGSALTDGSVAGDWRLPNRRELESLIDLGYCNPTLCNTVGTAQWTEGNPFTNVKSTYYWSSSAVPGGASYAWIVGFDGGGLGPNGRGVPNYVWPVRGGP